MKNIYYPLAGMNYIINDMAEIIKNKIENKKEIHLWLSAQVNSYPHIGTLTNFILAFALAKHFKKYYNKPVKIFVELLESVTGEEKIINGNRYYKNLDKVTMEDGKTIKEKYLPYFMDILERLKEKDEVEYEILFFYDYQKQKLVKKSLIEVINNSKILGEILDPKKSEIRLRIPCPHCGLTEKHIVDTKINNINDNEIIIESKCSIHGKYISEINMNKNVKFDMNVPLRYLVKILYLIEKDKEENILSIIVDGGDWSGMWPLRVYMEPLLKLKKDGVPNIIYTPTILDWSGSKLSKRMYVGNQAYREYLKEGLINYSEFYNQYGEIGFERLYNEINSWVLEPKKFIRDYTLEYIEAILNKEHLNYI